GRGDRGAAALPGRPVCPGPARLGVPLGDARRERHRLPAARSRGAGGAARVGVRVRRHRAARRAVHLSTFGYETFALLRTGARFLAFANAAASIAAGLGAASIGAALGRALTG